MMAVGVGVVMKNCTLLGNKPQYSIGPILPLDFFQTQHVNVIGTLHITIVVGHISQFGNDMYDHTA